MKEKVTLKIQGTEIREFEMYLYERENAEATIRKYITDLKCFFLFLGGDQEVDKPRLLSYKEWLLEHYAVNSVNSMLAALNQFLIFCGYCELKIRRVKTQKNLFLQEEKELTRKEYKRLVQTARAEGKAQLALCIETIAVTGIRVSEHRFITVEALRSGSICIDGKGKERAVFLPKKLQKQLKHYCKERKITTGPVFITKSGKPLNRCNIWAEMKALCKNAGIEPQKVFPHNLRHLFALTYYRLEKDIVRLADILGHANIETTRIYTSTTEEECLRSLSRMKLLL